MTIFIGFEFMNAVFKWDFRTQTLIPAEIACGVRNNFFEIIFCPFQMGLQNPKPKKTRASYLFDLSALDCIMIILSGAFWVLPKHHYFAVTCE